MGLLAWIKSCFPSTDELQATIPGSDENKVVKVVKEEKAAFIAAAKEPRSDITAVIVTNVDVHNSTADKTINLTRSQANTPDNDGYPSFSEENKEKFKAELSSALSPRPHTK